LFRTSKGKDKDNEKESQQGKHPPGKEAKPGKSDPPPVDPGLQSLYDDMLEKDPAWAKRMEEQFPQLKPKPTSELPYDKELGKLNRRLEQAHRDARMWAEKLHEAEKVVSHANTKLLDAQVECISAEVGLKQFKEKKGTVEPPPPQVEVLTPDEIRQMPAEDKQVYNEWKTAQTKFEKYMQDKREKKAAADAAAAAAAAATERERQQQGQGPPGSTSAATVPPSQQLQLQQAPPATVPESTDVAMVDKNKRGQADVEKADDKEEDVAKKLKTSKANAQKLLDDKEAAQAQLSG